MKPNREAALLTMGIVPAFLAAAFALSPSPALAAGPLMPEPASTPQNQIAPSDFAECERILASPSVNQLKARTEDGKYGIFEREVLSPALIGVRCRPERIQTYMEAAGWVLDRDLTRARVFENEEFKSDDVMIFYIPDRSVLSFFTKREASGTANFYFYDGRITSIIMGPSK